MLRSEQGFSFSGDYDIKTPLVWWLGLLRNTATVSQCVMQVRNQRYIKAAGNRPANMMFLPTYSS